MSGRAARGEGDEERDQTQCRDSLRRHECLSSSVGHHLLEVLTFSHAGHLGGYVTVDARTLASVSISVDLAELPAEISRFGPSAFLVTSSGDGPPRVSSVYVLREADGLAMRIGRRTRSNVEEHPAVSLVWPTGSGDYCLIVDGDAHPGPSDALLVTPTSAVLHRLATRPNEIAR